MFYSTENAYSWLKKKRQGLIIIPGWPRTLYTVSYSHILGLKVCVTTLRLQMLWTIIFFWLPGSQVTVSTLSAFWKQHTTPLWLPLLLETHFSCWAIFSFAIFEVSLVLSVCISVHHLHAWCQEGQRTSDLLELELKMVLSYHIASGNWTWTLWKSSQCS